LKNKKTSATCNKIEITNWLINNYSVADTVADTLQIKYLQHSGKKKYCTPSIKVYFPIIEALVSSVRTPVPRRETTVSAHGNERFQPEILAFPARDTRVSI